MDASATPITYSIGIDFGTAATGYSIAVPGSPVTVFDQWPEQPEPYCKNLTAMLYRKDGWKPLTWGWEAFKLFTNMSPQEQRQHVFLRRFKLALAKPSGHATVVAGDESSNTNDLANCPQLSPKRVIGDFLRFFFEFTIKQVKNNWPTYDSNEAVFVMTVPAGWSDFAKATMREAAVDAGIISSVSSKQLVLVHEPEAVAVCAVKGNKNPGSPMQLKEDETVIILDAGGGTVDVTCHKVIKKGKQLKLKEQGHRQMTLTGSTFINVLLEEHVRKQLPFCYDDWKEDHAAMAARFLQTKCEAAKRRFNGSDFLKIELPNELFRLVEARSPETLAKWRKDQNGMEGEIWLSVKDATALWERILGPVKSAVLAALTALDGQCDRLLIAGGFGESTLLIEQIKIAFAGSVQHIHAPNSPSRAVLIGAALYGLHPDTIFARKAVYAYGLKTRGTWREGLRRDLWREEPTTKKPYCDSYFSQLVAKDELLESDSVKNWSGTASTVRQNKVLFGIWKSEINDKQYTDDPCMQEIGSLVLDVDDPDKVQDPEKYKFKVSFDFGQTEMTVTAMDQQTSKQLKTQVLFIAEE